MAITSGTWWEATCDRCGEHVAENDMGGWNLSATEKDAREEVTDYDGHIEEDGTIFCLGCIEEDDDLRIRLMPTQPISTSNERER